MRAPFAARPSADFTKLWTASAVSNLGDGVTRVAGPLLVSTISDDPFHKKPWQLLFGPNGYRETVGSLSIDHFDYSWEAKDVASAHFTKAIEGGIERETSLSTGGRRGE